MPAAQPAATAITPAERLYGCDCCDAMVPRDQIAIVIAYGIETGACCACRGVEPDDAPAYDWHLGPAWEDAAVLEARAQNVQGDIDEIVKLMLRANDRGDLAEYDRLEEAFALADRELALLSRRIEELA